MYKDKAKQREATRKAMQRKRQGITSGITNEGITQGITREGITENQQGITEGITELEVNTQVIEAVIPHSKRVTYLARVVTNPIKRRKLQAIVDAFAESVHPEYAREVRYGVFGPTLPVLSTVLDITK